MSDIEQCGNCGNPIVRRPDPTGQRPGQPWAEHDAWGDDRDFQCGLSESGDHAPARERLEQLRAENISYGELSELEGLAKHIAPGDVELLEAAGVPEFIESVDVEVPVRLFFKVPAGTDRDELIDLIDSMFENGSVRDAMQEVGSQLATRLSAGLPDDAVDAIYEATQYDGFGMVTQ